MLTIDGGIGEGGGQILRTSLALSLCTGRSFLLSNIRPRRRKPGLQHQHLAALRAAAELGDARVEGARLDSMSLQFSPRRQTPGGDYHFDIGTAGSTTLVLQTVLPALMLANEPSTVMIEGGTHNPFAPPYEFIEGVFLPLMERMGPRFESHLDRSGFFPIGGGSVRFRIEPVRRLCPFNLLERGRVLDIHATAILADLPEHIAERELGVVRSGLGLAPGQLEIRPANHAAGPGNALLIQVRSAHVTELFSAVGERGVRAEMVADRALEQTREYLASTVPVGGHLADQLLVPFALAGGGRFMTLAPSTHTTTNIEVIKSFLELPIRCERVHDNVWDVTVRDVDKRPPLCGSVEPD